MGRSIVITFRLKPGRDTDIITALECIPEHIDRSDVIRAALRTYYNLSNPLVPIIQKETARDEIDRLAGVKIEGVELERKEKSAEELEGALDDLLNDF